MNKEERREATECWKRTLPKLLEMEHVLNLLVHNPLHHKPDTRDLPFGMLNFGLDYNRSVKKIREFEEFLLKAQFKNEWEKWKVETCERGEEYEDLDVLFVKVDGERLQTTFCEF
jgi:hypothetical protein